MFRLQAALTVFMFQTVFIVPNAAEDICEEDFLYTFDKEVLEIPMPGSNFNITRGATYCWHITQTNQDSFVHVKLIALSLRQTGGGCYDRLTITSNCPSGTPEMFCECDCQSGVPAEWQTNCGCDLTITFIVGQQGPSIRQSYGFNATLTLESSYSSGKSVRVILPVTLTIPVILIMIALLLVLVVRFKKFRKTNENTITGTSFTNSAYSQNGISTSTTLGKHDQVNGIFIERNGKPDQIEDKNFDHLEGEGAESNPVYVSGADDDQSKQEQAFQSPTEPNGINEQHEYAYVDSESLRGRQIQMMSNGQTAPNTTSEVRHVQGEEPGDQNDISTKKTVDGNLDHLEGEGVEYNFLYVSDGEDDQKNKQEHTYQSIKRKDENKPHEYTYIDLESLKGKDK